jgi:hypothetical protein
MARRSLTPKPARFASPNSRIRNALTASAERSTNKTSSQYRSLIQPWQQDAFRFYNTLGVIWYAAQFYARLSKLRIYAGVRDDQGEISEVGETDPASELLARVQDPGGGGYSGLIASYGRLRFLTGEGYLTVTTLDGEEQWEFLSCNELRAQPGGGYVRYKAPSLNPEQLVNAPDEDFEPLDEKQAVVWRIWNRSPEFSFLADSPMRGVLDDCEDLLLLQLAVKARAKSRTAGAGILYVPEELSFASPDGLNEEDPAQDPFQTRLQQVMIAPIQDPGQASAVVPAVIRGPAQIGGINAKDALFHLQIHDPLQTYPEEGLRSECIKRIATGLDMPPEILLGVSDSNHWSAWQIDDSTWSAHLQPVAQQFVKNLAAAYLRPAAKKLGLANWDALVVGYDAAEIINHPDRTKDAKDLWDRGAIGYITLRDSAGFDDEAAQTPEEHQEYLARILRDPLELPATDGEQPAGAADGAGNSQQTSATTVEEPPSQEVAQEDAASTETLAAAVRVASLVGAAELASLRTRELAGARLLRWARKECPECVQGIDVPKSLVASAIGRELAVKSEGGVGALVAGGAEGFQELCSSQWGLTREVSARLAALIEKHAGDHLFEGHQVLPAGFQTYVSRLLQVENERASIHAAA